MHTSKRKWQIFVRANFVLRACDGCSLSRLPAVTLSYDGRGPESTWLTRGWPRSGNAGAAAVIIIMIIAGSSDAAAPRVTPRALRVRLAAGRSGPRAGDHMDSRHRASLVVPFKLARLRVRLTTWQPGSGRNGCSGPRSAPCVVPTRSRHGHGPDLRLVLLETTALE
jgi:hypothetical protein